MSPDDRNNLDRGFDDRGLDDREDHRVGVGQELDALGWREIADAHRIADPQPRDVELDPLPLLDQSSNHLAANPESQVRLETRPHFTGETFHGLRRRLWLHHHGRSHRDLRRLLVTARGQ